VPDSVHDSAQTRSRSHDQTTPRGDAPQQVALERCSCPNDCDAASDEPLYSFDHFNVCRCAACGLVRLNPRLHEDELPELYEGEYFTGAHETGYDSYERDRPLYEKTFARRLRLIRRFKPAGTLLDIGCGLGYFMGVARRGGYDAHGLDCSNYAVEHCRALFPGRVTRGFLTRDLYPEKFFDVVTMFDLFEHVYHPREFLRVLHTATKDDGIVVVTTPNQRSLLARASRRNWVSYKIPEHVFYYTPETLRLVASPLFEVALVRSEGQYCSLDFVAERLKTLSRPLGATLLGAVRGLGVGHLPVYVNSGSMTVVLRKKV
jgi:SAM-dependent methyltransferase